MSEAVKQVYKAASSPSGALASAGGTFSLGMGTIYEILPSIIGGFATFGGIVLTFVLTYKYGLEIMIMRRKERERKHEREERRNSGDPLRRCEDCEDENGSAE